MKIIITNTFDKKFLKKLNKYFSILELINELKNKKIKIFLKDSFYKVKIKLNSVDFRGVVLLVFEDKMVPLILYLKNDKKYGENIIWNKHKVKILEIQNKVSKDLKNGDFKVY